MRLTVRQAFALLLCGVASGSSACTITGLRHAVVFTPGSAVLQASEIRSLTDWFVDLRDRLGIDFVLVHAYPMKGNAASDRLMRDRANAVATLTRTLGDTAEVNMFIKGATTRRDQTHLEVAVSINPRCARTNSCCPQPIRP